MANIGAYDAEIRALAWYDPKIVPQGWFDYGMPFDHPLIDEGGPPVRHPRHPAINHQEPALV